MDTNWPLSWPTTADELHIFDPNGDVLLKLVRHPDEEDESDVSSRVHSEIEDDVPRVEEIFEEEPDAIVDVLEPEAQTNGDGAPLPMEESNEEKPDEDSTHSDDSASSAEALADVHMRVSSKHLMLASPTFCTMLGPSFEEDQRLRSEGSADIALGDDDPDAFYILLKSSMASQERCLGVSPWIC